MAVYCRVSEPAVAVLVGLAVLVSLAACGGGGRVVSARSDATASAGPVTPVATTPVAASNPPSRAFLVALGCSGMGNTHGAGFSLLLLSPDDGSLVETRTFPLTSTDSTLYSCDNATSHDPRTAWQIRSMFDRAWSRLAVLRGNADGTQNIGYVDGTGAFTTVVGNSSSFSSTSHRRGSLAFGRDDDRMYYTEDRRILTVDAKAGAAPAEIGVLPEGTYQSWPVATRKVATSFKAEVEYLPSPDGGLMAMLRYPANGSSDPTGVPHDIIIRSSPGDVLQIDSEKVVGPVVGDRRFAEQCDPDQWLDNRTILCRTDFGHGLSYSTTTYVGERFGIVSLSDAGVPGEMRIVLPANDRYSGSPVRLGDKLYFTSKRNSASSLYSVPVAGKESEPADIGPVPADVVMMLGSLS